MTEPLPFDESRNDLERKYRVWLDSHAAVFALFEKFAMQMVERKRRFGMRMIAERVRWEVKTTWEKDDDGYKLNDHYTPYIARDLIAKYPDLADLIELRKVRSDHDEEAA